MANLWVCTLSGVQPFSIHGNFIVGNTDLPEVKIYLLVVENDPGDNIGPEHASMLTSRV